MSLCPQFCTCRPCEHGWVAAHEDETCPACMAPVIRAQAQAAHDASVARQKMKIKVAPWRKEEEEVAKELECLKHAPVTRPQYHHRAYFCPVCEGK